MNFLSGYLVGPLLLAVIMGVYLLINRFAWQKRVAALLAPVSASGTYLLYFSLTRKAAKTSLLIAAFVLLTGALLRPAWGMREQVVYQEGHDLLIAVDISRSMLAQDIKPNRIGATKEKIKQLVTRLPSAHYGLLVFSGSALVMCPLTSDKDAFLYFVDALDVETLSFGTTALDKALERALSLITNGASLSNKLLVLFTDGEDFSTNLEQYRKKAHEAQLRIFTIGMATPEGAPIPLIDAMGDCSGYQLDEQGNVVISRLQEPLLQSVARESGALYVRATDDHKDVERVVQTITLFEKHRYAEKRSAESAEQYGYFAFLSFVLFVIEWLL